MIVVKVHTPIGSNAPMPFAALMVDEICLDVIPTAQGFSQSSVITKVLIEIHKANYRLGLYPPVAVVVTCLLDH